MEHTLCVCVDEVSLGDIDNPIGNDSFDIIIFNIDNIYGFIDLNVASVIKQSKSIFNKEILQGKIYVNPYNLFSSNKY